MAESAKAKNTKVPARMANPSAMVRRDPSLSATAGTNGEASMEAEASGMVDSPASRAL